MKLLFCPECQDIFNLKVDVETKCDCGKAAGIYRDELNIEYTGEKTVLLGFDNWSFIEALTKGKPTPKKGARFEAFIISPKASSVKKVDHL